MESPHRIYNTGLLANGLQQKGKALWSPLLPSFVSRKVEGAEGDVIMPGLRQRARECCFFVFFYPPLEANVNRSQPALVQQPGEGKHSPESAQYFLLLQSL